MGILRDTLLHMENEHASMQKSLKALFLLNIGQIGFFIFLFWQISDLHVKLNTLQMNLTSLLEKL